MESIKESIEHWDAIAHDPFESLDSSGNEANKQNLNKIVSELGEEEVGEGNGDHTGRGTVSLSSPTKPAVSLTHGKVSPAAVADFAFPAFKSALSDELCSDSLGDHGHIMTSSSVVGVHALVEAIMNDELRSTRDHQNDGTRNLDRTIRPKRGRGRPRKNPHMSMTVTHGSLSSLDATGNPSSRLSDIAHLNDLDQETDLNRLVPRVSGKDAPSHSWQSFNPKRCVFNQKFDEQWVVCYLNALANQSEAWKSIVTQIHASVLSMIFRRSVKKIDIMEPDDSSNLYMPRFARGLGTLREALCLHCMPNQTEPPQKRLPNNNHPDAKLPWVRTHAAQYFRHVQYVHGICLQTGAPFPDPEKERLVLKSKKRKQTGGSGKMVEMREVYCALCSQWIDIGASSQEKNLYDWWYHVNKCMQKHA